MCPLVEGSPKIEAKAATEEAERLAAEELAGLRVGLLHGQMPAAEKEAAMTAFRAGEIDALVATTVIEVGVDVPERDRDDRRGRGPVRPVAAAPAPRAASGAAAARRGASSSRIPSTPDGEARMEAMAESTDGFLLAERDLEIRGSGQVLGERQAGFQQRQRPQRLRRERCCVTT